MKSVKFLRLANMGSVQEYTGYMSNLSNFLTFLTDLSNSIPHYIEEVDRFTTWCKANFLDLNVAKTKELLIDFRKQPPAVSPITIDGEIVERVEKYKYLGIILDNKLKFDSNVLNIYKKCHYRIYCLQRLRNIGINSKILALY